MEEYWEDQAETLRNKVESLRVALAIYADKANWGQSRVCGNMNSSEDVWQGPVCPKDIDNGRNGARDGYYLAQKVLEDTEL